MTCHVGRDFVICTPSSAIRRRYLKCWQCSRRNPPTVRALVYDDGYYGVRFLFACGHTTADGEIWPRYQGKRHRESTAAQVREVWASKLPPYREQFKRVMEAMGMDFK